MDVLPEITTDCDPGKMSETVPKEALEMIVEPFVTLERSSIAATLTFKIAFLTSTT